MRDVLNNSLEALVWIATAFFVLSSCYTGAMIMRYSWQGSDMGIIIGGFLTIVFGITLSFVFAGICFQIMDIRKFTKHAAISLNNRR